MADQRIEMFSMEEVEKFALDAALTKQGHNPTTFHSEYTIDYKAALRPQVGMVIVINGIAKKKVEETEV